MADYTLSAKIVGDSSGLEKAFANSSKSFENFQKKLESIGSGLKTAGDKMQQVGKTITTATTAAGIAIGGFVAKTASMAGELEQNIGGSEAVFGDYAKSIQGYAKDAYSQLGLTESNYLATANKMGSLFKGAGFETKDAMDMTSAAMQRAADVASIMGIDIGDAMESVAGAAKGNFTMMDNLGVAMNDTAIKAYALENQEALLAQGLNVTAKEMDQNTKIGVAMAMFLDKTADYAGNYAKENDTFAGSLTTLKANFANLGAEIGGNFLPILTPLIQKAGDMVTKFREIHQEGGLEAVFQAISDKIREASPLLGKVVDIITALKDKLASMDSSQLISLGATILSFGPAISIVGKLTSAFGGIFTVVSKVMGVMPSLSGVFTALTSPIGLIVIGIMALVAAFAYLMATNEGFREGIMSSFQTISEAVIPVVQSLMDAFTQIGGALMGVVTTLLNSLAPAFMAIVECVAQVIAAIMPFISQLIDTLVPVILQIVDVITNIVEAVAPAIVEIITIITSVIQELMPIITSILDVVMEVVAGIIEVISPIIDFIGQIISAIMAIIRPIISFIGEIIKAVVAVIKPIIQTITSIISTIVSVIRGIISAVTEIFSTVFSVISGVFNNIASFIGGVINTIAGIVRTVGDVFRTIFDAIYTVVSTIMNKVKSVFTTVFDGIKGAWEGLKGFVSGVFDGIKNVVNTVINGIKGVVNFVINAINGAVGLINLIPGVNIGKIPNLQHGTDDWQGGFARMNEGGRGELTYLPSGTQVIPHDISVKYAKEAARANNANGGGQAIDYDRLIRGFTGALGNVRVQNTTTLDGKVLANQTTPLIDKNMGTARVMEERYV